MWGNFKLVFNQNLLSSALDYIAMQMIKGNREKGFAFAKSWDAIVQSRWGESMQLR